MIMVLGYGIVFTALMGYKNLSYRALFHSSRAAGRAALLLVLPAIALTLPLLFTSMVTLDSAMLALFPMTPQERTMLASLSADSVTMIVAICLLAPVLEEMFYRGIILRSFLGQYPKWAAILASAGLFGFAHMNIYQYVGAVIIGVFLGWLYEPTRSLLPCMALHAASNTACIMVDQGDAGAAQDAFPAFAASTWLLAMLLGAVGMTILYRVLQAPAGRHGR